MGDIVGGVLLLLVAVALVVLCRPTSQVTHDEPAADLPFDPADLDRLPPDDVAACDHCGGTGGIWVSVDPADVLDCPICAGEGILPDYWAAS